MTVNFLVVATPQTESELAVMVSLLEAHGIQHYVHNQGFGGLYPGMQIELYNARRLMVPSDQAADARELLSIFSTQSPVTATDEKMSITDKLRVLFETCVFGWSFPRKRRKLENQDDAV
jgi:hypothetical protein